MRKLFLILPVLLLAACEHAPAPVPTPTGTHTPDTDECPRRDGEPCR